MCPYEQGTKTTLGVIYRDSEYPNIGDIRRCRRMGCVGGLCKIGTEIGT